MDKAGSECNACSQAAENRCFEISRVLALSVAVTDDSLVVDFHDGRTICLFSAWLLRLLHGMTAVYQAEL